MSRRLLDFFVAPAEDRSVPARAPAFAPPRPPEAPARRSAARRAPWRPKSRVTAAPLPGNLAVLAAPADALVAAGGLGASLRAAGPAPVACLWPPVEDLLPAPGLGVPKVAAVVRRLTAHGLDATPAGAAVLVRLDADPAAAVAQAHRAEAVAGGPIGIVLTRRHPKVDVLLGRAAIVVVLTGADPDLDPLAVLEAKQLNPAARPQQRPTGTVARMAHRMALLPLAAPAAAAPPGTLGREAAEPAR